jgi:hypothetical protein
LTCCCQGLLPVWSFEDQNRRLRVRWAWDIACPIIVIVHPLSNLPPCWQSARLILYMSSGDPITPANYKAVWAQGTKTTNCSNLYIFFFYISHVVCSRWRRSGQIGALSTYIGVGLRFGLFASETSHRLFRGDWAGMSRLDSNCAKLAIATDVCLSHILPRALV